MAAAERMLLPEGRNTRLSRDTFRWDALALNDEGGPVAVVMSPIGESGATGPREWAVFLEAILACSSPPAMIASATSRKLWAEFHRCREAAPPLRMSYTGDSCDDDGDGDESDLASVLFGGVGSNTRGWLDDGVTASNVSVDGWVDIAPRRPRCTVGDEPAPDVEDGEKVGSGCPGRRGGLIVDADMADSDPSEASAGRWKGESSPLIGNETSEDDLSPRVSWGAKKTSSSGGDPFRWRAASGVE